MHRFFPLPLKAAPILHFNIVQPSSTYFTHLSIYLSLHTVRRTYNHADYLEDRRRMMQSWADLDGLKAGGNVIVGKFGAGR